MDENQALPEDSLTVDQAVDALMERHPARDEQGRFAAIERREDEEEAPATEAAAAPEGEDAPAEVPAEEAESEEVNWDEVKNIKLKVPMKADGKEWDEEVTLEQLRNERMMYADYQRKTTELSQQRRQAEEAARQAVTEAQSRFAQELQTLEAMVDTLASPDLQNVDLNRLAQEDPAQWARLFQQKQQIDQAKQAVRSKLNEMQEKAMAEHQLRMQAVLAEGMKKLTDPASPLYVEGLETKAPQLTKLAVDVYGLTAQEAATITDPRLVKMLADAAAYRDLQAQKPEVTKKVLTAPKALKVNRPDPKASQNAAKAKLRARLDSGTASLEDAIAYHSL